MDVLIIALWVFRSLNIFVFIYPWYYMISPFCTGFQVSITFFATDVIMIWIWTVQKGSIAFKQDFLKCARALHNFLHSYDPAWGIQIKLRKYTRSILKSSAESFILRPDIWNWDIRQDVVISHGNKPKRMFYISSLRSDIPLKIL